MFHFHTARVDLISATYLTYSSQPATCYRWWILEEAATSLLGRWNLVDSDSGDIAGGSQFSQEHRSSWVHSAFFCDYPHNTASCRPPDPQTLKIQIRWCVCHLCSISILLGHIGDTYPAYAMMPWDSMKSIIQVSWQAVSGEFKLLLMHHAFTWDSHSPKNKNMSHLGFIELSSVIIHAE